jgi:hypothetical protein
LLVAARFSGVFLRRHRKTVDKVNYDYWSLCESVRTASGPRQRVVATLGKLDATETGSEAGWEDLQSLLEGRRCVEQQMLLGKQSAAQSARERWEVADVAGLRVERVRDFGQPWLGLALWHRLGLHTLLKLPH